ncbi:TonB-system energizer ExbB [Candidatus Nitrosoglobus terrae]|uniref:Biopolymer transport protein ExbB n=1 Tax=Candidatus Nitrosoglobus terrae TaxID=1630141 RepID=A0A1Q2SMZ2_9GAMM|nr:tonB-system energizer ExbB [Candidatus Nitrosoglobus terrae]BAW80483.1 TonB-system energizer ExbB [Candidatus Nitrosoglobus terrae]
MKTIATNIVCTLFYRCYVVWSGFIVFFFQEIFFSKQVFADTSTEVPIIGTATLPYNFSPWGMFLNADPVVKVVIIGLIFASIMTWAIGLAKNLELGTEKRNLQRALEGLNEVSTLTEGIRHLYNGQGVPELFAQALERELYLSSTSFSPEGIKERIALRLGRLEAAVGRDMARGIGILASIGSTAPFVGLFGTVWGIMDSFIGISKAQITSLAVVSPGIAESLLVTAIGLITAVPAVVIYNFFARSVAGYRALLADISSEILQLVSRDLDQRCASGALSTQSQQLLLNMVE